MGWSARNLQRVFLVFAVLFVCSLPFYPYAGGLVIKAIPAGALAVLAARHVSGRIGMLLTLGFGLSAAGDAVLGLHDLYGGIYFVAGLGLFLMAHLFFVGAFARGFRARLTRRTLVEVLVALVTVLTLLLRPRVGEMAVPVFLYMVAITVMAVLAVLREMEGNALLYGGLAFLLSDALIAVDKFLAPIPAEAYLVMTTYYFAQFMIAQAFLKQERSHCVGV